MDLNDYAIGLAQKEIIDLNVRIKYLKHQIDMNDIKIATKVTERNAAANDGRSDAARQYRQKTIQQEIDQLREKNYKLANEIDEQTLIKLYYEQELGLAEEPKHG